MSLQERFESKFEKSASSDCWEWTASKFPKGYGQFRCVLPSSKEQYAHRVSVYLYTGSEVPKGKVVMHSCDNTSCVNPSHLSVGTQADNIHDTRNKSRNNVWNKRYNDADRELAEFMRGEGAKLSEIANHFKCSVGHASLLSRYLVRTKTNRISSYIEP